MQSFIKEHPELIEQDVEILNSDIILKPFEKATAFFVVTLCSGGRLLQI